MWEWLHSRVHVSWHLAWLASGVVLGIALALVAPARLFAEAFWLVVAWALLGVALIRRLRFLLICSFAAGLLLGLGRGCSGQQALGVYQNYYKKMVVVQGRVSEDTSYGPQGDQRFRLQAVLVTGQSLPGELWVSTTAHTVIKRGDNVVLQGLLGQGFGSVPATMFRAQLLRIARPRPGDIARRVRDWFAEGIRRAIPEPEASLGIGYLIGQRSALPTTLDQQFRIVGLTHAVVASGYNLTILVSFARRRLMRASKYLATLVGALLVVGFMLITGLSPSMSRAGLVAGLSMLTWYYGRRMHTLVLLPVSAAITAYLRPAYVWGDIGWALSFTAFVGVIILAPLLQRYFWGPAPPGAFRQLIVETIAAQLATMPIILLAFGQYSVYALPANLLVLPLVPAAMACTFIGGAVGIAIPGLAPMAGWPARILLGYSTHMVGWIAGLPGAQSTVHLQAWQMVGLYAGLILAMLWMWRQTDIRWRDTLS